MVCYTINTAVLNGGAVEQRISIEVVAEAATPEHKDEEKVEEAKISADRSATELETLQNTTF